MACFIGLNEFKYFKAQMHGSMLIYIWGWGTLQIDIFEALNPLSICPPRVTLRGYP